MSLNCQTITLNEIDQHTEYIVHGFIRNCQLYNYNIPNELIYLCLQYYYTYPEHFCIRRKYNDTITHNKLLQNSIFEGTKYGHNIIPSTQQGIYEWTFFINQKFSYASIYIGIDEHHCKHLNTNFTRGKDTINYGYCSGRNGYGFKSHSGNIQKWGAMYDQDDIISMILDLFSASLSFRKNGKDIGIAYDNIKQDESIKYRMCVARRFVEDSICLLSYKEIYKEYVEYFDVCGKYQNIDT
eukprot:9199_1